jgi:hypothetical protein
MFANPKSVATTDNTAPEKQVYNSTFGMITQTSNVNEINFSLIDEMLDNEKRHNKTESWIKLNKTEKIQKLHQYAEKYGKDNGLPAKDIRNLKTFFTESLNNNKLQKAKDVVYDKEERVITNIPSLHFNIGPRNFTLKIMDTKRVSTIKSLTPKKEKSVDKLADLSSCPSSDEDAKSCQK